MNEDHFKSFELLFGEIYQGNVAACAVSMKLVKIANTWDDLIDRDPVTNDEINKCFVASIFEVQNSPLWFQCGLNHHVLNCYLRWRDANTIEGSIDSTDNDLHKCYMLRAGIYDIFVIIAFHLFGDEWAKNIGPVVRRFYSETLNDYIEEMKNA